MSTYEGRFAIRLKELREKAKLTAEQAAERMGITEKTVFHWEAGRSSPHVSEFPKIAAVYKLKKTKDIFPNE
jgi:transcriptional regulator with XRE-family HTH domain